MTNLLPSDIRVAVSSEDQEAVVDRLNSFVLQLRRGLYRLPVETARELIQNLPAIKHPLEKVAAWEALEFSPPFPEFLTAGMEWLKNPRNDARAQALGTVLSVFPDQRDPLIKIYENETDQFMRYAIARSLAADRPRQAWERLCQLVKSEPNLSMELEELIPDELADLSFASDLPFIEQQGNLNKKTMVWTNTERILRERLKMFGN